MRPSTLLTIIIFCSLTVSGQNVFLPDSTLSDTTVVAWVNGLPLEAKWLQDEMRNDKHLIMSSYAKTFGRNAIYQEDFWGSTLKSDSVTPLDELREMTFQRLCSLKAKQYLLKQYKLIKDTRYSSLLDRMEKLNKHRIRSNESGGVIYGPIEYTPQIYYQYFYAEKEIELKRKLLKKEQPKEEELKKLYLKYLYNYNLPEIKVHVLTVLDQEELVKKEIDREDLFGQKWTNLADLLNDKFDGKVCASSEVAYGYFNAKLAGPGHAGYEAIRYKVGDILPWAEDEDGRLRRIKVVEKVDNYTPYSEARSGVLSFYGNRLYRKYLGQVLTEMSVDINKAYYEICL